MIRMGSRPRRLRPTGGGRGTFPWVGVSLIAGCAPLYRPPPPFLPLLGEAGDLHAAAHLGTGGAQLDAGVATGDWVAVRAGAQVAGIVELHNR